MILTIQYTKQFFWHIRELAKFDVKSSDFDYTVYNAIFWHIRKLARFDVKSGDFDYTVSKGIFLAYTKISQI